MIESIQLHENISQFINSTNLIKINGISVECISPWPSCLSLSEAFFTVAFMLTIMLVSIFLGIISKINHSKVLKIILFFM